MSSNVNIPVNEIVELYQAWLDDEVLGKLANETVREIKKNARTAFDDRTRNLYRSIKRRRSKFGGWIVGAFAPHAHLVERGHRLTVGKDGRVVGHVPPHPFVQPAADYIQANAATILGRLGVPTVRVEK